MSDPVTTPAGLSLDSEVLRGLLAMATERPWDNSVRAVWCGGELVADVAEPEDAELIVAAVNALPDLLAAAEAVPGLQAENERLREACRIAALDLPGKGDVGMVRQGLLDTLAALGGQS